MFNGALNSFDFIFAPISESGSIILFIGRFERLKSPTSVESKFCPARIPAISLIVVPEFPQSSAVCGWIKMPLELIFIVVSSKNSVSKPKFLQTFKDECGSFPLEKFLIIQFPFVIEANITALCEIDLSEGIVIFPLSPLKILLTIFCIVYILSYNNFMDNIFIETERLILREMYDSDFTEVASMMKSKNVMYAWEYVFEDIDVLAWIKKNREYYRKYNLGYFLAVDKKLQEVVGQIALMPDIIEGIQFYDVGYILNEKFWHKGYAYEGAEAVINYAFNKLNLDSVIFEIRPENSPSIKVAEKFGAKVSGEFLKNVNGKPMKHLIFTLKK